MKVFTQGKHRYYSLEGPNVANALEALDVTAGSSREKFVPGTPSRLLLARTCYDHMAGTLGVSLHNRLRAMGWLSRELTGNSKAYDLTPAGAKAFEALGVDLTARRPHAAGSPTRAWIGVRDSFTSVVCWAQLSFSLS